MDSAANEPDQILSRSSIQKRTALRAEDETTARAKRLRREATAPERALWSRLKGKQLGVKFRRQHPMGPYIADFFCDEVGLVVEVDSSTHDCRGGHDLARDAWMSDRGLVVLRFHANDVMRRVDGVLESIVACVEARRRGETGKGRQERE